MATVVLAPGPFGAGYQALTAGGLPLSGGFIDTYAAGGSTPTATYTTVVGNVQNSNPIQLDSAGRPPAEIWLIQGTAYKFIVTDSLGANAQTFDNLTGINDVSGLTPQPIPIANGGTAATTTNAALDSLHFTQATVTAAGTLNLDTMPSAYGQVTGNTPITAVTLTNGRERTLLFLSTVAVSSNSVLILPGGTTITTASGDTARFFGEANSAVRVVDYQRAAVAPATPATTATTFTFNGTGGSTGTLTLTSQKLGLIATLSIPSALATTGTNSNQLASNTALPLAFRPTVTQRCVACQMQDNGATVTVVGIWIIDTAGIVTLLRDAAGANFTNTTVCGTTAPQTVPYFLG